MSTPPDSRSSVGLVIVDHGSTRGESNRVLEDFTALFAATKSYSIVEPAHMELCEPSIASAFRRCVERGAAQVVVVPYFLAPGKHWHKDIPALAADASKACGNVPFLVSAPIGLHPLMADLIESRVEHCLKHADGEEAECEYCAGTGRCKFKAANA